MILRNYQNVINNWKVNTPNEFTAEQRLKKIRKLNNINIDTVNAVNFFTKENLR